MSSAAQIVVLDAGGQYCHLIARKVRDLGVYSEVRPSETPAAELSGVRGLIISGGPNSVYDPASPTVDPAIFSGGARVLGICYGQQLMAHLLGGTVQKGEKGEYGFAMFNLDESLKVAAETDTEVERAIDAMPKAKALLDTVHRIVVERMQPQPILAR